MNYPDKTQGDEKMNVSTHLKTLVFGMFLTLVFLTTGTGKSLAAVQPEDVSLGGICPNMTYEEITDVYGAPSREEQGNSQLVHKIIFYGDDVEIGFCNKKVLYVTVTADNGWRTPQGLYAGMNLHDAISICGQDYKSFTERQTGSNTSNSQKQVIRYVYRCAAPEGIYSYVPGDIKWGINLMTNGAGATQVDAVTIRAYFPEH